MWVDYFPGDDESPIVHFQDVTKPCSPTKLFRTSGGNVLRLLMSCFNLTAQQDGRGSLYYIDFLYSVTNDLTTFTQREFSIRTPIYGLHSVSEAVYADNLIRHDCFVDEEMYVFDQSVPLHTSTETFRTPDILEEGSLEDCSEYHHVEYSSLDRIIIYCTNERAAVYSMCANEARYYEASSTGIPYPCLNDWSYVVYKRTDRLVVMSMDINNGTEIEFTHEIKYGKCTGTLSDLLFWGLTLNGTLIRVSLSRRELFVINDTCHNSTCLRPMFSDQDRLYSYFKPTTLTIMTINSTSGHRLPEIQLPFHPDMYTIHTGPGFDACVANKDSTTASSTSTPATRSTSQYIVDGTTVTFNFVTSNSSATVTVLKSVFSLLSVMIVIAQLH